MNEWMNEQTKEWDLIYFHLRFLKTNETFVFGLRTLLCFHNSYFFLFLASLFLCWSNSSCVLSLTRLLSTVNPGLLIVSPIPDHLVLSLKGFRPRTSFNNLMSSSSVNLICFFRSAMIPTIRFQRWKENIHWKIYVPFCFKVGILYRNSNFWG